MKKVIFTIVMSTLLFGKAFAAEEAVFTQGDDVLEIPKVSIKDSSGKVIGLVSAKLKIIKGDDGQPLIFEVTELPAYGSGAKTDEHGCVAPQTWHAAMNHCMVQK